MKNKRFTRLLALVEVAQPDLIQLCKTTLQTNAACPTLLVQRLECVLAETMVVTPGQVGGVAVECITLNNANLGPHVC